MQHRLLRFIMAGASGLAISAAIQFTAFAAGFWLGGHSDNLWYLLKLTVPYALLLAVVAGAWPKPNGRRGTTSPFILGALGLALSFGYWYFIGHRVPWFLSFAIQALACWSAAGVAALLFTLSARNRGILVSAAAICLLAIVVPSPAFDLCTHNQSLTVAFVVPEALTNTSALPGGIGIHSLLEVERTTSRVLQTIRAAGFQENYRIVNLLRVGKGKQSLAVLILSKSVTGKIFLEEPNATEVIYIQQPNGWAKIPARAPTLRRSIEIGGDADEKDTLAYFEIPDASGNALEASIRLREGDRR